MKYFLPIIIFCKFFPFLKFSPDADLSRRASLILIVFVYLFTKKTANYPNFLSSTNKGGEFRLQMCRTSMKLQ